MPRLEDFLTLNSFIYDAQPPATITVDGPGGAQEWVRLLESNASTDAGYYAAAYLNAQTNEIVIVNRGTNDLADLVTDMQMALDVVPDQLERAERFYGEVRAEAVDRRATLSITGHSLGGSLTQLLIATHANDEINGSGVFGQTFNALGVKGLLNDLGLPEADYAVTNWVTPTDVVGNLAEHIGTKQTLASLPFSFLYPAGPPGVLAFIYDSHKIAQVRDTFVADNSHPLLAEAREFLLQTYVTDFGFPVTIDGQVIVGGNNRINVGNELNGSAQNDLLFGGLPDDRIHGGDGQDIIYAGPGNDTIWGEAGADILLGEDGDDTYHVDDPNDRVIEAALGGTDTVASTVTYTLSNNVEQLVLVGEDTIDGTGNALDNVLIGNNGANVLDGGFGKDAMAGGVGDDTYIVDNSGDAISEAAGEGTDTVQSSADYVLPANVEKLILTGAGNIGGTGNELNNEVIGNDATNVLTGGLGNDLLKGGTGFDTYLYTTGDGLDRIEDAHGQNAILFDQQLLQGGIREAGGGAYTSLDGRLTYAFSGTDLVVNGVLTLNEHFQNGQFGIRLFELPAYAAATRTEFVKVDHYQQIGTDPEGNPIYEPVYAPFFDDNPNNTTTTTDPGRLVPSIGDDHHLIHALGGNDLVISGAGDDQVYGEEMIEGLFGRGSYDRQSVSVA